jgi:hypothetical protein
VLLYHETDIDLRRCRFGLRRSVAGYVGPVLIAIGLLTNVSQPFANDRLTPDERQRMYEQYFAEVCEKKALCDTTCKEVFRRIEHKERLKLQCQ